MRVDDRYIEGVMMHGTIESFMYTSSSSLRRGNYITSKVTSLLGYSMNFVLLRLMTWKPYELPGLSLQ